MKITERNLRSIIKSVIKENFSEVYQGDHNLVDQSSGRHVRREEMLPKLKPHVRAAAEAYFANKDAWNMVRNDFQQMACNDSRSEELKRLHYSNWSEQDFIDLITALDGRFVPHEAC